MRNFIICTLYKICNKMLPLHINTVCSCCKLYWTLIIRMVTWPQVIHGGVYNVSKACRNLTLYIMYTYTKQKYVIPYFVRTVKHCSSLTFHFIALWTWKWDIYDFSSGKSELTWKCFQMISTIKIIRTCTAIKKIQMWQNFQRLDGKSNNL
jgi:hypothetical protein